MKKLLRLLQEDVIQIYVAPGTEYGDLHYDDDEQRYEKFYPRGPTYNILDLLYEDDEHFDTYDEVGEDKVIEKILTSLERERKEWLKQCETEKESINRQIKEEKLSKTTILGNVYLMRNIRNGYTKIGFTKNYPKYRERTLQSQEPEVKLLNYWKGSMQDEEDLHNQFDEKRERGEWFKLTEKDVQLIEDYFTNQ